ncbi:MAG: MFS transporter, partial [Candidatus Limnocylindrales bacterium]
LGPAFGASILGSVLNSTYQSHLQLVGLPAQAAAGVKGSVFGGIAVARQLHSAALLASVRTAFVAGMDDAIRVAAAVAVAGIVLALVLLPAHRQATATAEAPQAQAGPVTVSD